MPQLPRKCHKYQENATITQEMPQLPRKCHNYQGNTTITQEVPQLPRKYHNYPGKCHNYPGNATITQKMPQLPRKCHNHEAQPSLGIKQRADEGQKWQNKPNVWNHRRTKKICNLLTALQRPEETKKTIGRSGVGWGRLKLVFLHAKSHKTYFNMVWSNLHYWSVPSWAPTNMARKMK